MADRAAIQPTLERLGLNGMDGTQIRRVVEEAFSWKQPSAVPELGQLA
jgi:hypothetical protein